MHKKNIIYLLTFMVLCNNGQYLSAAAEAFVPVAEIEKTEPFVGYRIKKNTMSAVSAYGLRLIAQAMHISTKKAELPIEGKKPFSFYNNTNDSIIIGCGVANNDNPNSNFIFFPIFVPKKQDGAIKQDDIISQRIADHMLANPKSRSNFMAPYKMLTVVLAQQTFVFSPAQIKGEPSSSFIVVAKSIEALNQKSSLRSLQNSGVLVLSSNKLSQEGSISEDPKSPHLLQHAKFLLNQAHINYYQPQLLVPQPLGDEEEEEKEAAEVEDLLRLSAIGNFNEMAISQRRASAGNLLPEAKKVARRASLGFERELQGADLELQSKLKKRLLVIEHAKNG